MSYIKANVTSEYDNNQMNGKKLQSVTPYATNVTVVESQSISKATNVRMVESQSIHSISNDFNWSASDDPSEMNYNLDWSAKLRSQKLKITDTHVDFEHYDTSCCFDFKVNHHISLDHIWLIRYYGTIQRLDLLYSKDGNENAQSCVCILGLNKSSNTPKLIKDTIIQRRRRKTQTKRYTIPNITSTSKKINLISENALITYVYHQADSCVDMVAFVDGLGDIDKTRERPSLEFWSPPVGRPRSDSDDGPEMTIVFRNDESCATFKEAVEDSRDSFK